MSAWSITSNLSIWPAIFSKKIFIIFCHWLCCVHAMPYDSCEVQKRKLMGGDGVWWRLAFREKSTLNTLQLNLTTSLFLLCSVCDLLIPFLFRFLNLSLIQLLSFMHNISCVMYIFTLHAYVWTLYYYRNGFL